MKIVKIYEYKRYNRTVYNAKVKIDNVSHHEVMKEKKIIIGWERCRVFDGTNVI